MKSCCFTGHRPKGLPCGYDETGIYFSTLYSILHREIVKLIYGGCRRFYTGLAEGVDIWCAEMVLEQKRTFPDLELYAIMPFPKQRDTMNEDFKGRYDAIISCAHQVICTSDTYSLECYKLRNYFMVDHSDTILAVYDAAHWRSGTGQTVRYAEKLNKTIICIDPKKIN